MKIINGLNTPAYCKSMSMGYFIWLAISFAPYHPQLPVFACDLHVIDNDRLNTIIIIIIP